MSKYNLVEDRKEIKMEVNWIVYAAYEYKLNPKMKKRVDDFIRYFDGRLFDDLDTLNAVLQKFDLYFMDFTKEYVSFQLLLEDDDDWESSYVFNLEIIKDDYGKFYISKFMGLLDDDDLELDDDEEDGDFDFGKMCFGNEDDCEDERE